MAIESSNGPRPAGPHDTSWLSRLCIRLSPLWKLIARLWGWVLDIALVPWVIRVPLVTTFLGLAILGAAPQAQDLFVEFAYEAFPYERFMRIALFLLLLFFVWAMPTHYAARLLLDTDVRFQNRLHARGKQSVVAFVARWTPRALGLLTFVAVLIAIRRSDHNLPDFKDPLTMATVEETLGWLEILVIASASAFFAYTIWRPHDSDFFLFRILKRFNHWIEPLWRWFSPGAKDPQGETSRNVGRFLLFALFATIATIFLFGPDFAAKFAPRSMAVPFILGGWLPFLSYLSALGRQWRAPLILGLFVLVAWLAVRLGDNHVVRRINAHDSAGVNVDVKSIPMQDAVALWEQENHCSNAPASCPRPIIVAASGGASRAGFFVATILGHFMKESHEHGLDPNAVRNRLFAISSVSGSSLGAVMVAKALDQKADSEDFPCKKTPIELWWGPTVKNWRDCFEALTSGDFLTADFFGFAFNDMLPLPLFGLVRDRAAVLEDAWKARYHDVVTPADSSPAQCNDGLDCPFLSLKPRSGHWIPLLVLNGTSEATGGRIVTTPLQASYMPQSKQLCPTIVDDAGGCILFVEADHFHDLLNFDKPDGVATRLDDVRLSTAAHNSARFPLISPPGSVLNYNNDIVDRIVDGGYFENSGALGAKELALAIRAVEPKLTPFVLIISNDPDDPVMIFNDPDVPVTAEDILKKATLRTMKKKQEKKARTAVNRREPVTDILTPVMAIINTRSAHGVLGMDELRITLNHPTPKCTVETKVRVWPQLDGKSKEARAVSMSWWLSPPVQLHLHQQTDSDKTDEQNEDRLNLVWDALKATSSTCVKP
jgi:hypothetical protein